METQQEVERLEQAWWRKNITPIEEAQRAGNYQEALDKCNEVMSRLASEDYKKQLENQQQQIVNDWAEEVLGQIQPRLQEDASEAHLQEVMIELEQVLNLDPEPTMWLRQLQDALQTAHTLRLRAQLRKAKEHDEEEAYEKALAVVQRVREEIDALDIEIDFTLLFEINDLEWDIKEHKYQALLEQARQKKKAPEHRDDLEQVRDLSGQMLGLPGFEDDAEAKRIQRWAVDELRAFDETKRVLEKCENLVRQRRLSDARYEIRELENVSDLLKPSYEQQRNLISVLRRARDDQKNEAWEAALKGYTQAFEMDSRLIPHLEGERDYVTKKFVASIQRKIEMVLQKPDPDTHKAEELVEQIEAYDVIQETFRRELTRLRDYIASQENVKEALELLDQGEDGEPLEKAQEALQEARRLLPDDVSSGSIQQWQLLVKALLAWSRGERRRAKQVYDRLAPPALDHPRAVELKEAIASAEAVDQNIEDAQKKIREFLSAEPVRYDEAIDILDSLTEIEMDDRVKALQRKVIGPLYRELKRARQTYHYAEAIEYGKLLQSMPGIEEEKEKIQVIDQLSEERRTKLNERIAKAEAALAKYKLSEVEKFLVQAETIAAPKGDPRLPDLRGQLEARQRVIEEEVKPGLQKLHVLIGNQQWSDAVDKLLDVRSQAPNHKNVEAAVDDLQNRLYTQAETLYEADNFDQALDRCEDGLRLRDDRSDLLELQGKIRADREARLIALRAEIEAALDIWRLEEASEKLREGKQISSSDQKLEQLDDRLQKRKRQLPELRQSLDAGWKDLRHRDYLAAKAAFEDALAAARSFTEAEGWRDYAESMNEAVKLVESEGDEYKQVAELLFNAEQAVRVKPEHPLPDVWESEDYLRERHRQAVYDAHRLRQVVHRMIENYREYEKLFKQSSHDAMSKGYEFYQQVLEEKETLRALHRTPASPPDDFPTDGLDEEAIPSSLLGSVDPVPAQAPKVRKESGKLEEAETDEKPPVPEMVYGEDKGDSDEKFEAERIEETPEQSDEGGLLSFIKGFRRGAPTEDEESKKGEREPEGVGDEPSTPEAVSKPSRRPSLEPEEAEEVEEVEKVKDETEPTDEDTVDAESPEESVSPPPRRRPGKPRKREDREVPSSRAEEASSQGSSDVEEEGDSEEEESTSAAPGGDYADLDEVFGGFGQTTLHSYEDEE
jgi:hypothetical protein